MNHVTTEFALGQHTSRDESRHYMVLTAEVYGSDLSHPATHTMHDTMYRVLNKGARA